MVPHPLGTRLPSSLGLLCAADRVRKYELRTAGVSRAALPFVLGLFMGQLRAKYQFCAVWALSAAV